MTKTLVGTPDPPEPERSPWFEMWRTSALMNLPVNASTSFTPSASNAITWTVGSNA